MKPCKRCGIMSDNLSARGLCPSCTTNAITSSIEEQRKESGTTYEKWGFKTLLSIYKKFGLKQILSWLVQIEKEVNDNDK